MFNDYRIRISGVNMAEKTIARKKIFGEIREIKRSQETLIAQSALTAIGIMNFHHFLQQSDLSVLSLALLSTSSRYLHRVAVIIVTKILVIIIVIVTSSSSLSISKPLL